MRSNTTFHWIDADAVSAARPLTVALADTAGLLSATAAVAGGGGTITGAGTFAQLGCHANASQGDAHDDLCLECRHRHLGWIERR